MTDSLKPIAALRAPGEDKAVEYNEDVHPGIVTRSLIGGVPPDRIAAYIGIDVETLTLWMEAYPAMRDARMEAEQADLKVVQSIHELATGWYNPSTGKNVQPNVAACIFWLKARMKWSDQPPPQEAPLSVEDMTMEQLIQRAEDLRRAVDRVKPIDVTPGQTEAGF